MRRYILALALSGASAFLAPPAPAAAKTVVFKKKDKDTADDAEPVQVNAMSKGTVVEFDLNKHTTLGVIDGHKVKAKGGLRYEIKTSDGKLHAGVAPRDIHFSAPPRALHLIVAARLDCFAHRPRARRTTSTRCSRSWTRRLRL